MLNNLIFAVYPFYIDGIENKLKYSIVFKYYNNRYPIIYVQINKIHCIVLTLADYF